MALTHSPKIITDGLVFAYDMYNTQKSYIGEPTTNLFYSVNNYLAASQNWTNSGAWTANDNDTSMLPPSSINASVRKDLRVLSGVITTASSQGCQFGSATVTVSPNTTYTMSCYYMQNRAMANNASPYMRGAVVNDSKASFAYNGNTNQATWPVGKWIRITATATMQSNETGIYLSQYFGETVGDRIWMCGFQVEQRSYATPLTAAPRTTTGVAYDLTGNYTITANSLTYASNGTYSFNNSTDKMTLNSNSVISGVSDYTIDAIIRPTITSSVDYIFGNYGSGNNGGLEYYVHQNKLNNYIQGNSQSSTTLIANQWYSVCVTRSGNTITHYLNGVADGSSTLSGSISATNPFTIGNGHDYTSEAFGGNISAVKVYNKSLTATEVKQNYNAVKERFLGYQALTYVYNSYMNAPTNNGTDAVTFTKASSNNSWDGGAYCLEPFTAPCTIEFSKQAAADGGDNGASYAMIGWNTDPTTDSGYGSIDHASYPFMMNRYEVYNNGSYVNPGMTWDVNQKFYLVYDTDGYIRHYNGSKLLYSANYGTGNTVYVDMSLYTTNTTYCKFQDVRVCRRSWNGTRYV